MDNNNNKELVFEDISSSSVGAAGKVVKRTQKLSKKAKKVADNYGNSAFRNIDKVIKIIAFVVSITFFLCFLLAAGVIFLFDKGLLFVSALILLIGTAISFISLYLIYGLGHMISQNKEILRRLNYYR